MSRKNHMSFSSSSSSEEAFLSQPDIDIDCQEIFGIKLSFPVRGFATPNAWVPQIDPEYCFVPEVTAAILAGFACDRRVMIHGFHGTGKSTHIEQIAARLHWPCIRVNLDSQIGRLDLIGKDVIELQEGRQVTNFREGVLPWSLQRPCALIFDEYDAGRPDVMFVIQRVLEKEGKLTLLDHNRIVTPHPYFRLFATANTIGRGDPTGLYHGTRPINQGQMDRWHIVVQLNYLPDHIEEQIIEKKVATLQNSQGRKQIKRMVQLANLTRVGFRQNDIGCLMSPRSVLNWAENLALFDGDLAQSFRVSFFNKSDVGDQDVLVEYYQRVFGEEI